MEGFIISRLTFITLTDVLNAAMKTMEKTMPRNPSELARLEEELKFAKAEANDLRFPKEYREACLRDVRKLEATLGIEGKGYNRTRKDN